MDVEQIKRIVREGVPHCRGCTNLVHQLRQPEAEALVDEVERLQQQVGELDSHNLELRGAAVDLEIECDQLRARNALLEAVAAAALDVEDCCSEPCRDHQKLTDALAALKPAVAQEQTDAGT